VKSQFTKSAPRHLPTLPSRRKKSSGRIWKANHRAGDRGRWIQRRAIDRGLLSKCQRWYAPEPGHTRQQAACSSICDPKALTYSANTSWATSSRPTSGFFTKAASAAYGECSNDARTVRRSYSFTCNSNERAASGAWSAPLPPVLVLWGGRVATLHPPDR
jgi:hypothetical protein